MNLRIPKRIIQTHRSRDLPLLSKAAATNIKLLNPDFEYLFFDDKGVVEFIDQQFPEYRCIFDSFRYAISRYDFFRYLAIYHYGGFYLDLDVFLASSLSGLLDFDCVFPFEDLTINMFLRRKYGMDWEIGNYAFGAKAEHPFLKAIIRNCVKAQKDPDWVQPMLRWVPRIFREGYYVLCTTGPGLISRTLAEYPAAAEEVKVLFPENVCDFAEWSRFGTFGVHLMKGTWRVRNGILWRRLYNIWLSRKEKRLFDESQRLGHRRSLEFRSIP